MNDKIKAFLMTLAEEGQIADTDRHSQIDGPGEFMLGYNAAMKNLGSRAQELLDEFKN